MYIYHALTNAVSANMIHINLNMTFYKHSIVYADRETSSARFVTLHGTVGSFPWAMRRRQTDRQTDRQTENSNSKTLFYKDCSLVKKLSNN